MLTVPPSESLAHPIDVEVAPSVDHHTNSDAKLEAGFVILAEAPPAGTGPREIHTLPVSGATRALSLDARGTVRLIEGEHGTSGEIVQLEVLEGGARPTLLLANPPGSRLRVNGLPAAPLSLLAVGDVVELGAAIAHVSYQRVPQVGPVPAGRVGEVCPVCRIPVTDGDTALLHDCGRLLHRRRGEEVFECALVSSACAHCEQAIVLEDGLAYWPEG